MPNYCEVALPVPLRSVFTYAIPERLAGSIFAGSRVLVPFRNRAMTGVVVELSSRRPDPARVKNIKEVVEALDPIPALTPKLIELGRWVANYYVCPPGEVFRAMLPPQIDLRHEREFLLTDAGRERRDELDAGANRTEEEIADLALLSLMRIEDKPVRADRLRKLPGGEAAAERLLRRRQLESREVTLHRHARVQKIVAWNSTDDPQLARRERSARLPRACRGARAVAAADCRETFESLALADRTAYPPGKIEMLGRAARGRGRFVRSGLRATVEHSESRSGSSALDEIKRLDGSWRLPCGPALRRHGQREDGSVSGSRRSGAGAQSDGADSGAGDRAHALAWPALPRAAWGYGRGAAQRSVGCGARARMVARAARRSARRGGDALGGIRAGRKRGADRCG